MIRLLSIALLGFMFLSPAVVAKDKHHHDDHPGKHKGHHKQEYRRGVVYVERRVYVDDYSRYELHAPPSGHRWVRSDDGKYVLIAVATGIIADVLLHH